MRGGSSARAGSAVARDEAAASARRARRENARALGPPVRGDASGYGGGSEYFTLREGWVG
jgi:hypothetical protein